MGLRLTLIPGAGHPNDRSRPMATKVIAMLTQSVIPVSIKLRLFA
jgi:hypothetical protein